MGNLTATDVNTGDTHVYALIVGTGSEDNARFTLTSAGILSFSSAPDFENPSDSNSDNIYSIRVIAIDDGNPNLSTQKTFAITVTNSNEPPIISDKTFSIAENANNNSGV